MRAAALQRLKFDNFQLLMLYSLVLSDRFQNESGFFERLNGDVVCSKAESSGSSNDREKQRMMISAVILT